MTMEIFKHPIENKYYKLYAMSLIGQYYYMEKVEEEKNYKELTYSEVIKYAGKKREPKSGLLRIYELNDKGIKEELEELIKNYTIEKIYEQQKDGKIIKEYTKLEKVLPKENEYLVIELGNKTEIKIYYTKLKNGKYERIEIKN